MRPLASVRIRLVGIVFLAVAPGLAILFFTDRYASWIGFLVGILALTAAWIGGELFIMRQIRALLFDLRGCRLKPSFVFLFW